MTEEPIEDVEEAKAGAYAEKSVRDLFAKYQEGLPPEAKEALEKIAGKEGEEAIKAFQEKKSLEDPRIDALRTEAARTIKLTDETRELFVNINPEGAEITEQLIKQMGMALVDRIITDPETDFSAKAKRIIGLGPAMDHGVDQFIRGHGNATDIFNEYKKSGTWTNEKLADLFRGNFAAAISNRNSGRPFGALEQIAKLEERDVAEVIQEYLPIIVDLRQRYPELLNALPAGRPIGLIPEGRLDSALKNLGFLWSPGAGTYIAMAGETAPTAVEA